MPAATGCRDCPGGCFLARPYPVTETNGFLKSVQALVPLRAGCKYGKQRQTQSLLPG